jgi:histone deacetylase complex regulatory component SIN3
VHVEFDHALDYVVSVKRRFSSNPGTFKTFLEILRSCQKEQRGINDIVEEVAELFKDHLRSLAQLRLLYTNCGAASGQGLTRPTDQDVRRP